MTHGDCTSDLICCCERREENLAHLIHAIQPYLHQYGYLAVFAAIFLEDFGVPMPGETMLIAASLFASQGDMNIYLLDFVAWSAAVLGDNTGYAIGRFGGRRLVLAVGKYVFLTHKRLDYAEGFFRRRGAIVVIVARFIEILRQLNGIIAGTVEMHWLKFLAYNSIGAALWVGLWSTLFYVLGQQAEQFGTLFKKFEIIFLGAAATLLLLWMVIRLIRKRKESAEKSEVTSESSR